MKNLKVGDKVKIVKISEHGVNDLYSYSSVEFIGLVGIVSMVDDFDRTVQVYFKDYKVESYWFEVDDVEKYPTIRRGFEVIADKHRKHEGEVKLPVRGDSRSAGYDFFSNETVEIMPGESHLFWTDVKSYMLEDEMLSIHVRSSIGLKKGLMLKNTTGIIDSSYFENPSNDGNIGICLVNMSDKVQIIERHERIAQGVFSKYLVIDNDTCLHDERTGGFGSSGK